MITDKLGKFANKVIEFADKLGKFANKVIEFADKLEKSLINQTNLYLSCEFKLHYDFLGV